MKNKTTLLTALTLVPTLAHAHPGHGPGFAAGFAHPVSGLDHVLAMVAVGLWAAQLGGRARWSVPAAFVAVMTLGSVLGMNGVSVPLVEPAIFSSVVILGLLILAAVRLPLAASMTVVGTFALFHGLAHGAELPANASGFTFVIGFALATAALHGMGLALGAGLGHFAKTPWVRFAGGVIALVGVTLALG